MRENSGNIRIISEQEVRSLLDPLALIDAIEGAFRDRYLDLSIPPRMHIPTRDGISLIMPCYDRRSGLLGVKTIGVANNTGHAEHSVRATYMLLDAATSAPKLILAADYLTEIRTAATSAVATRLLARDDVKTLAIFGTGRQARAHAEVIPLVRKFEKIYLCGRDQARTRTLAAKLSTDRHISVEPATPELCATADVICTCTSSKNPLFDGALLRPGSHLNLVGTFEPHAREVDSTAIARSRVVVDTYEGAFAEAGDIIMATKEGAIAREHVIADLHQLATVRTTGRLKHEDVTLFKSVGCALEDLVAAQLVRQKLPVGDSHSRL